MTVTHILCLSTRGQVDVVGRFPENEPPSFPEKYHYFGDELRMFGVQLVPRRLPPSSSLFGRTLIAFPSEGAKPEEIRIFREALAQRMKERSGYENFSWKQEVTLTKVS